MEEIRIDCANFSEEEIREAVELDQKIFKLNHTMPHTKEYDTLVKEVFPNIGEGCRISTPIKGVRTANVYFGKNVVVMPGSLMMSAGGIHIGDDTMIAANVQLISNNHDLYERSVITCLPIKIGKNVWIGAGATILPGVTIGDNAVVGAASVVTKDVEADTIVAGNPARFIRKI